MPDAPSQVRSAEGALLFAFTLTNGRCSFGPSAADRQRETGQANELRRTNATFETPFDFLRVSGALILIDGCTLTLRSWGKPPAARPSPAGSFPREVKNTPGITRLHR